MEVLPLLVTSGAAAVIYYYVTSRDAGKPNTSSTSDPGRTGPVDSPLLDLVPMPAEAGVSCTHTDNAVTEIPPQTDTLAEAERRCKEAIESNTHLERKNIYLTSKVNILEDEVSRTRISCNDIMRKLESEQEDRCILESRCKELHNILEQHEELWKVSLAELERKSLQMIESNLTLQNEKSELQGSFLDMKNKYSKSENNNNIQQKMHVKAMALLENEKQALEEALAQSTSELEDVYSQAHQLEDECASLIVNLGRQADELHSVESSLSRVQTACDELMTDNEHKERMLKSLTVKWKTMNQTVLNNYNEQIQVHNSLRLQHQELKEQHDQLVKDREDQKLSLAVAMESSALLEKENSELVSQVHTLQGSMMQLKEELSELHRHNKEMEQGQQQGTSIITPLQSEPSTLDKTKDELMRVMRFATMVEQERANMSYHISVLQNSVHELEQMLSDAESKCGFLKQEKDQAVETLNSLRIHQTIPQCDELVTSLSEDSEPTEDNVMNPT